MHILFIGYGKTSKRIAKQLFLEGHQITAISASFKEDAHIHHIQQDVDHLDLSQIDPIDYVYVLLSPKESTLAGYQKTYVDTVPAIVEAIKVHPVKRLIVVSSTRVYNGCTGEFIDDTTQPIAADEQGQCLIQMEQAYQKAYPKQCVVIRPTGIYGTSVERMIKLAQQTHFYETLHFSNRIHIEDLARFLASVIQSQYTEKSYIVSNSKPYPLHEVILWFQKKLNIPLLEYHPQKESGKKIYATALQASGFQLQHVDPFADYAALMD